MSWNRLFILFFSCLWFFIFIPVIAFDVEAFEVSYANAQVPEKRFIKTKFFDKKIVVFNNVYSPENALKAYEFMTSLDLRWAKNVLDIGTGCGILGLLALKQGAEHVIATDISPAAVENATYNAKILGFEDRFEVRLVLRETPEAYSTVKTGEQFDLIISNPPGFKGDESYKIDENYDFIKYDPGFILLKTLLTDAHTYLKPHGKIWLMLGGDARKYVKKYALEFGFSMHMEPSFPTFIELITKK